MNRLREVLLIFLCGLFISGLNAKIWVVDNNPNSVGDFTTLVDAQAGASSGDTIFVYPSATVYAGITVTKQLVFFGVGFNLDIYGGQASEATAALGNMNFAAGSEGSLLEGFAGDFYVDVNTSDITVKRNNLSHIQISSSSCIVIQNEIYGNVNFGSSVYIDQPNLSDIIIANNKIRNISYGDHAIYSNTSSTVSIVNNILHAESAALAHLSTTSLVQNNIITGGKINTATSAVYQYNMCQSDQLPTGDGNILNVDMNTVFENPSDWVDGLHLLPGSPAIGSGFGGTDMGIYGGDAPYMDGGFPELPAIFHLESEVITTSQNGLDALVKAKSNKE